MFKNYLKIALRNVRKHKSSSIIYIVGLSIGIACSIFILLFVKDELSYDKFNTKSDRIYRITREWFNTDGTSSLHLARVAPPIGPLLINDFPQIIDKVVRIRGDYNTLLRVNNKTFVLDRDFFWAEKDFFSIFSFQLIKGNPKTALKEPNSVVLTESTAHKFFGNEDPMGKTINYENDRDMVVTGIMEDVPKNSHLKFSILGSFVTLNDLFGVNFLSTNWGRNNYLTYVLLKKGVPYTELEKRLPAFIDEHLTERALANSGAPPTTKPSKQTQLHMQKLTDIHLHSHLNSELEANGNITNIYLFSTIAIFILLIACINFMNLATARSSRRAREIGMRKVLGAEKRQLIKQFLVESIFISVIALFLAIIFVEILLKYFNNFIGKELELNFIHNPLLLLTLFGISLFVGIVAGSYPAFLLSSFKPATVLKGDKKTSGHSTFRTILVVVQFTISIGLIASLSIVNEQMNFVRDKKLGFNKDHIVILPKDDEITNHIETIKSELLRNPNIKNAAASGLVPSDNLVNSWGGEMIVGENTQPLGFRLAVVTVDQDFIDTYDMKLVAGRKFSRDFPTDTSSFIINESAAKKLGFKPEEVINKPIMYGHIEGKIVGVLKDFNFESLHNEITPIIFVMRPNRTWDFSVRLSGTNIPATIGYIKNLWEQYRPDYPFEYSFLDDDFNDLYRSEQKLGQMFSIFSFLAIIIACLGLLGLASFMAEQKTKEIGIRKVLGASIHGIVILFSKEFIKWILIADIIAVPIAYYFMNSWLSDFAYRIHIGFTPFLLSGLLALFIALFTVSYQAIKTAMVNPVKSLKYE